MSTLILRYLKDRKTALIIYIITGVFLAEMYISLFTEIKNQADQLTKLLETYPDGFKKAFGLGELVLDNLQDYMAMEQFNFILPLMVIFMTISFIGRGISGEIEKGTIELTLAHPISRMKFFASRIIATLSAIAAMIMCNILGIFLFATFHNIDYLADNFVSIGIVLWLFAATIAGITALASSLFSDKGKVYGLTGGLLVVMYIANIIASLNDSLKNLKYISFFHYYNPPLILGDNTIETQTVAVFALTAIITLSLAAIRFSRRDIAST